MTRCAYRFCEALADAFLCRAVPHCEWRLEGDEGWYCGRRPCNTVNATWHNGRDACDAAGCVWVVGTGACVPGPACADIATVPAAPRGTSPPSPGAGANASAGGGGGGTPLPMTPGGGGGDDAVPCPTARCELQPDGACVALACAVYRTRFQCNDTTPVAGGGGPRARCRWVGAPASSRNATEDGRCVENDANPASPAEDAAARTTDAAVAVTAVAAPLVPEGVLHLSRLTALQQLAAHCDGVRRNDPRVVDYKRPLPFVNSPTRARFGPEAAQYYRGAAVANPCVLALLTCVALVGATVQGLRWKRPPGATRPERGRALPGKLWLGMGKIKCPDLLIMAAAVLLNGTVSAGVVAARHGPDDTKAGDTALAVFVTLLYVAIALGMVWYSFRAAAFDESQGLMYAPWPQLTARREEYDDDVSYAARPRPKNTRNALEHFWLPSAEWRCETDADYADRNALGMALLKFRQPKRHGAPRRRRRHAGPRAGHGGGVRRRAVAGGGVLPRRAPVGPHAPLPPPAQERHAPRHCRPHADGGRASRHAGTPRRDAVGHRGRRSGRLRLARSGGGAAAAAGV